MSQTSNSQDGAMLSPAATMIETASGGFVDVYKPDPGTLILERERENRSLVALSNAGSA